MAKKGSVQIVQATTSYHYHVLPSDLARATISAERAVIFEHLSRIGPDRFVDFVTDLLVHAEGHQLVDRTDGTGDEKQDILTLDPRGRRHLTQCKHTEKYGDNTSGDELDQMFSACMRKDCQAALYVTNADLTPQAKRYITDREYGRGWKAAKELLPEIDYWNGPRIWDRASKSNAVLNKWFGGMAQAHALRRFMTDLVITRMPGGEACQMDAAEFAARLGKTTNVTPVPETRSYDVAIDKTFSVNLSDWFRGSGDLGVRFLLPGDEIGHPNVPLKTLRVQAFLTAEAGRFDVDECRDRIANAVAELLPDPGEGKWWQVLSTGPEAFVFLQAVGKAVHVPIGIPEAFVHVGNSTAREASWAVRPGPEFTRVPDPDDTESEEWRHEESGAQLRILVEQEADPLRVYEMHLRQEQLLCELREATFRAVENASPLVLDTIRRLCLPDWRVLTSSDGSVLWAYPPDADIEAVERLEGTLARRKVQVLAVSDETKVAILGHVDSTPTRIGMIVSGEGALSASVSLDRRTFWFSREIPVKGQVSRDQLVELVKYKTEYEAKNGSDALKGELTLAAEELMGLLFDPMTVRGRRMIDIGVVGDEVAVHWRVREQSTASAAELAVRYHPEFAMVFDEVAQRLGVK